MSKLDSFNLGELYRDLRIARGLKMKDIVNQNLSQAQLSKFENGLTMLSADKLLIAISAIHMSLAEFEHAYNQYEDFNFFKQAKKISSLHGKKDVNGLKDLLSHYDTSSESYDIYNQLNCLVIKSAIKDLEADYPISESEIELITAYLYSIEDWTEYELFIFGNTLQVLSTSNLVFLGKAFIKRDSIYLSLPNNRHRTHLVLINIIFELIKRSQDKTAELFIKHLETILDSQDMFARAFLIFFQKILDFRNGKITQRASLENYIQSLWSLGFNNIAAFLQDNFEDLLPNDMIVPVIPIKTRP